MRGLLYFGKIEKTMARKTSKYASPVLFISIVILGLMVIVYQITRKTENFTGNTYTTLWYKRLKGDVITTIDKEPDQCRELCNSKNECQGYRVYSGVSWNGDKDPKCVLVKNVPKFTSKTSPDNYTAQSTLHSYIKN